MEKLHYLRWSLTGSAARMLWGTEEMTFRQIVARLRPRFGSYDMEEFCPQRPARISAGIHYHSDNGSNRCRTYGALESSYLNRESYLRVSIGDQVYDCLLDTGSEVCLFRESIVGSARMDRTNKTLKAANVTTIPILCEVNLPVNIGSYSTQEVGLVSQHVPEPMLGIDFLTRNKAVWNFDKGLVWIAILQTSHICYTIVPTGIRGADAFCCKKILSFLQDQKQLCQPRCSLEDCQVTSMMKIGALNCHV